MRLPSPEVVQAALADLALRAGDLLAVVVNAEVVAGVALLDAVLAGTVAGQRPNYVRRPDSPAPAELAA